MQLTGQSIIAGEEVTGSASVVRAIDPRTEEQLEPGFPGVGPDQIAAAAEAAATAFPVYRQKEPGQRAAFLDACAAKIDELGDTLVQRTARETGLAEGVLTGELARTTNQLRLFATLLRDEGGAVEPRVDPAQTDGGVDIRQQHVPLGPVAVFGPSNFPLAFSTAGGDTASALAAGCPVVVKAHPSHPGASELVARAIREAVTETGMPPGVFSLVHGSGPDAGAALVADPRISAVGFTGSQTAGTAMSEIAARRDCPIPVFAEMSSINPVFLLPGGVFESLADGFLQSLMIRSGQMCTSPGLLFVPSGPDGDRFVAAAADRIQGTAGQTMLTPAIARAYERGTAALARFSGVETVAQGLTGDTQNAPAPQLFVTDSATFRAEPSLQDEVFGPAALIVRYTGIDEACELAGRLKGQLTATIHAADTDHDDAASLLPILERSVGRLIFNGWPTGVAVNHAMVHGGPFPATTDSRTTSVGTLAIRRFQRPVSYQSLPPELLPAPVQPDNPWQVSRRVDGKLHT